MTVFKVLFSVQKLQIIHFHILWLRNKRERAREMKVNTDTVMMHIKSCLL